MERLFQGAVKFKKTSFEKYRALYEHLGTQQNPHTLFIGCSDSRVVPTLVTKTMPGELFVVRNIANIVPPYRETNEYVATTSAIEYAIQVLEVENIIVCGHSNCGGCQAIYHPPEKMERTLHVKKWLELLDPVKKEADELVKEAGEDSREMLTEQLNIVQQIRHLMSYNFIRERHENGLLNIYGWHYIIETGDIYNYNWDNHIFELIQG